MKEFELKAPEGADESLKAAYKSLSEALTTAFNDSKKESLEAMQKALKEWGEKNSVPKEELEKINNVIKAQGEALKALKENPIGKNVGGLKAAFDEHYDELVKAIKERRSGFEIKAVNEHTATSIQTTDNSIDAQGNAIAQEIIGNNYDVFGIRRGRQYIHDIASVSVVDKVPEVFNFWEEGDETGAIAVVTENSVKPQVHTELIKNQVDAQKAAGYMVVTEEMIKWRPFLWSQIQRLFNDKVWRDYEKLLTTQLIAETAAYANTAWNDTIANPTDLDAIIAAVAQLEATNFRPDVIVLNPNDKWKLALTETTGGMLILPYIQAGGEFRLLGLRVITTTEIAAGTFMVGEAGTWFIQEERPSLRTGLVNDDLIHNRVTIVGELWFLSYVPSNNDGSFVKATFASVKEALKTPASTGGEG